MEYHGLTSALTSDYPPGLSKIIYIIDLRSCLFGYRMRKRSESVLSIINRPSSKTGACLYSLLLNATMVSPNCVSQSAVAGYLFQS